MYKKLLLILVLCLTILNVHAETDKVHVAAVEEFDTVKPLQQINVRVIEPSELGSHALKTGDIIHCNVIKVTDPKRGKRSASFAVCPTSYTSEGNTVTIEENYYGKYASKIISKEELKNVDKAKLGKKAVLTAGNFVVKGFSSAVSMTQGMIKNEEGNRLESGVKQVYKDSPLVYVEKGEELEIKPGDSFYLIFKPSKSRDISDITKEFLDEDQ